MGDRELREPSLEGLVQRCLLKLERNFQLPRISPWMVYLTFLFTLSGCVSVYTVKVRDLNRAKALEKKGEKEIVVPALNTQGKPTFIEWNSLVAPKVSSSHTGDVKVEARDFRPALKTAGWSVLALAMSYSLTMIVMGSLEEYDNESARSKSKLVTNVLSGVSLIGGVVISVPLLITAYVWDGPEEDAPLPSSWTLNSSQSRPIGLMFSTSF